ncbi:MAG TPA: hypothetical protein VIK55_04280 [Paludibacter sp.]
MKTKTGLSKHDKGILTFVFVSIFLLSTATTFAQKPNFSGTWTYNESKSKLPESGFRMIASKITVAQDALALNIERVSKGRDGQERITKEVITLDGKECENVVFQDRKRKSTATWSSDGKSLSINSSMTFERNGESMVIKSTEVWLLGDDNNSLSLQSTSTSQNGELKATLVYDKAK